VLTRYLPINQTIARAVGACTRKETQIMHIPRQLKTSINRLAHSEGIRHESRIKALLIEQMEAMRSAGADEVEMQAYLTAWQPSELPDVQ
jgi:hypothetical protein